jgi:hypothetical protein
MVKANGRKRLYQAVCAVLFHEWDPIGVRGNALAADEYDSYAPAVCRMLAEGADEVRLAAHLWRLRTNAMGLSDGAQQQEHDRRVARRLVGLRGT